MKTQVVDPQTVDDYFTRAAQAMWAMVWAMTGVNEEYYAVTPALAHDIERFGNHRERLRKGIQALTEFYRTYLGERGEALITEYFEAKWASFYALNDDDPARTRFEDAQRALNEVHGGLIVDDHFLLRLTDQPAWSLKDLDKEG
jgi:hypothetical protein